MDANPLISTGVLVTGATEYNVGQAFEIGKYISQQVGAVTVFIDGQQQYRNPANGTSGGNYQEDENTLRHFRSEFWQPGLSNRDSLAGWQQKGCPVIDDRAGDIVKEILNYKREGRLDPKMEKELMRMCE